jgi:hypothetical protein
MELYCSRLREEENQLNGESSLRLLHAVLIRSEWELRVRRAREDDSRVEAQELATEVEGPLYLPTPAFMACADVEGD